ncbi:MAG TPA: asparagine synthase (glutamine-hydrolyzing) [Pyrinomonadaceae bacterium]|nr:asparagine synthase (glutamine-hydrolyzing) [Pyrinomonadaceae bacterium]
MCGIAGLLFNKHDDLLFDERASRLDTMVDALTHRGPDDHGALVDGPVAIGMRRLAIIDSEGGHQPITNEDGTVWVVYNGECYNFQELREQLTAAGHSFSTRTDTEVVVHGYEEWGARGLAQRLNGIFAFCLWDARQRIAYLVRDRLGVKPLYYTAPALGIAFSSELRSLARSGFLLPKLDEVALWSYLLYQYSPTERTLLSGALRLPAGHLLEWRADTHITRLESYWDLSASAATTSVTFAEASARVGTLLDDAVHRQMISDVPIGCFLSGGLDSSAVAALIAKHSSQPVRTFSIGFPSSDIYDETEHAEAVARAIGARHTTVAFDEDAFVSHVEEYLGCVDEPVADAAMLPTYLLAKQAAQEVKVVLTGEGADEVFAGYDYYRRFIPETEIGSSEKRQASNHELRLVRQALAEGLGGSFPAPDRNVTSPLSGFPYTVQPEFVWCMLSRERRPSLKVFTETLASIEQRLLSKTKGHSRLQRALYTDTKLWLGHDLMTKLDKSTMAHSLEARVPFLDHRLVEYAFSLPDSFKLDSHSSKRVLRAAVAGLLPKEITARKKQGFGVPLMAWFRGPLRDYVRDLLLDSALVDEGILTRRSMEAILFAHNELHVDMARTIWSLVNLDCWWRAIRAEIAAAQPTPKSTTRIPAPGYPSVDILIPIYENFALVRDCVRSIQRFTEMPFRVILLDDASSAATYERLQQLVAADGRFQLVRNDQNRGFVQNCIGGMRLGTADYIVLLNSDTVVAPGWLERMVACAESDPRIAIVNPLTNESGNTSVRLGPGLNLLTMAQRIAELSRRDYPDITTAVGMCLLMRRSALDQFGGFDSIYKEAYCEESDLCMRFTEAGLRVVAADDAFIYHKGWASYAEGRKQRLYERNRSIFDQRWRAPFDRDWSHYYRHDPLQYMRNSLLRLAVNEADAQPAKLEMIENRVHRLGTTATLRAVGNGARTAAATALLPRRAPAGQELEFKEWSLSRIKQPLVRFEERGVFFPTREYMATLPQLGRDRLRITFLISSLPLAGGVISICQLAREMLLAGHDVKFVTEARVSNPEELNLWLQPLVYRDERQLIEQFPESDIVVATFWTTAHSYMQQLRERNPDFVSVYFIQDYESWFYPSTDWTNRRNVISSYATTEHHIVKSRWLAGRVNQHGPGCEIVPLGLDLGVFYPRGAHPPSRPRVVAVAKPGSEATRRGFHETIEIFHRIHAVRPEVELVFYGAEPERMPSLPFEYTNMGLIFDQSRVAELISSADVLLDASLWQGFGRPGLEAMACGTVPVLTNVGGLTEYARDGENCVLVSPGDAAGAASATLRLIDEPRLYGPLAESGRKTAERFSHVDEAQRHLELYQRWVTEKRTATRSAGPRRDR